MNKQYFLTKQQITQYRLRVLRDARVHSISWAARHYGLSRQTIYRWSKDHVPKQRGPSQRVPWQTDKELEALVCQLRLSTNYGPKRIKAELAVLSYSLGEKAIRGICARAGLVRNHRKKRVRTSTRFYAPYPGYRMQVDTKAIEDESGDERSSGRHQFTAIDIATRIRFIRLYDGLTTSYSIDFVHQAIAFFAEIGIQVKAVQTDNHSTFTNLYIGGNKKKDHAVLRLHPLTEYLTQQGISHILSRPGTPKDNTFVERSHRTDSEEFYRLRDTKKLSYQELSIEMKIWQDEYNCLRLHSSCNYLPPMKAYLEARESVLHTGA